MIFLQVSQIDIKSRPYYLLTYTTRFTIFHAFIIKCSEVWNFIRAILLQ